MNKTVQKAIEVEYTLLRTPLAVLDERVLTHLGKASRVRSTVERAVAVLDGAHAKLLGAGSTAPAPARVTPEPVEHPEVPVEEVEQLAEELLEQQETEHVLAGELADDEELRRVQAELRAKHQVEEQEQQGES